MSHTDIGHYLTYKFPDCIIAIHLPVKHSERTLIFFQNGQIVAVFTENGSFEYPASCLSVVHVTEPAQASFT